MMQIRPKGLRHCYVRLIRQTLHSWDGKTHLLPTTSTGSRFAEMGAPIPDWRLHHPWPDEDLCLSLRVEGGG